MAVSAGFPFGFDSPHTHLSPIGSDGVMPMQPSRICPACSHKTPLDAETLQPHRVQALLLQVACVFDRAQAVTMRQEAVK